MASKDPTGTLPLENQAIKLIAKKYRNISKAINKYVVVDDKLKYKTIERTIENAERTETYYDYNNSTITEFEKWLENIVYDEFDTSAPEEEYSSKWWWLLFPTIAWQRSIDGARKDIRKSLLNIDDQKKQSKPPAPKPSHKPLDDAKATPDKPVKAKPLKIVPSPFDRTKVKPDPKDLPIGKQIKRAGKPSKMPWKVNDPELKEALKIIHDRGYKWFKDLSKGMVDDIKKELIDGMKAGRSPEEIAARMDVSLQHAKNGGQTRAEKIARTEITNAHQRAKLKQMEQTQQLLPQDQVVLARWITMLDDRVRDEHASWEGKLYTMAQISTMVGAPNCRCSYDVLVFRRDLVTAII